MDINRRNVLAAAGGTLLTASALALPAEADEDKSGGDTFYGHGMVWNRALPGVAGELRLMFDLRLNLEQGAGFGTAEDPVYSDWNIHFAIGSVQKEKRPKGEARFTMTGNVIQANILDRVGLPVRIIAETSGDATAIAIRFGDLVFAGAGLVVVAIKPTSTLVDLLIRIILRG